MIFIFQFWIEAVLTSSRSGSNRSFIFEMQQQVKSSY